MSHAEIGQDGLFRDGAFIAGNDALWMSL